MYSPRRRAWLKRLGTVVIALGCAIVLGSVVGGVTEPETVWRSVAFWGVTIAIVGWAVRSMADD